MIKARYSPATEDLAGQVASVLDGRIGHGYISTVIDALRNELGYEVSIEVEVHGAMEAAFKSLEGDTSEYVLHQRPVRRIKT